MSDLKIETGIPMPPEKSGPRKTAVWHEMAVGDSVFVAGKFSGGTLSAARASGKRFATRKVDGGTRVWRVE